MAMEIVNSLVGKVVDRLFDAIGLRLGYLFHYKDNLENLKKETSKLENTRERVLVQIGAAERSGDHILNGVKNWVHNSASIASEAENFLEDEVNVNKRCLKGWCINLTSRYRFSEDAKQKTKRIVELREEGIFETVSRPAPPPGIEAYSIKNIEVFESRKSVMKQIMEALYDDNIQIIGICGMGGVGKTTLVKEMGKQLKENKLFDEVAMAVVSETPNVTKIRQEIACMLGRQLGDSDESAREGLWARLTELKGNKILVILDDVWSRLDLDAVGIPSGKDHMNCKIVLTTRSREVCNAMEAQKIIPIGVLSKQEEWVLFREKAGGEAIDSNELNPIARKVARECGGLPLAIVIVGTALRNKNKHVWEHAARQLKKSTPTNIIARNGEVYPKLELSYNYLESEEAKSIFLLCCLFPEDYNIKIEKLVRYGMGLGLFEDVDTVEDARDRTHTAVSTLIDSFLLLDGFTRDYVKMHDVVRDLAITIASKDENNFLVKAGIGLREWPHRDTFENYTGISLMSNDISELPVDEPHCPKLKILLLQGNFELIIPDNFYQGMKDLKVLHLNYTLNSSLSSSLPLLTTLRTLCLTRSKFGDISLIGELRNLEILILSHSSFNEVPVQIGQLTNLRLLNLRGCKELTRIAPGVISSLRKLEELYVGDSFVDWEDEVEGRPRSNASLTEINSLSKLTGLDVRIPKSIFLLEDHHFQNLTRFNISIGHSDAVLHGFPYLRNLTLKPEMRIPLLGWIKELKKTESLYLDSFEDLMNIPNDLDNEGFNELKCLYLRHCRNMKYLVDTTEWAPQQAFSSLEKLCIIKLEMFSEICHGQLPVKFFSNIQILYVDECHKMLTIVPSNLLPNLQNLKSFTVQQSNSLEYVFELEGLAIEEEERKLLSMLTSLMLFSLPKLVDIWKGPHEYHQYVSLCNLKEVGLLFCNKLRRFFSPTLAQGLVHLDDLNIAYCDSLEEIFGTQEEEVEMEIVACSNDPGRVPCLQNLTHVNVGCCGKLRNLFSPSIAKGLAQLKTLTVLYCTTMQYIIEDENAEPQAPPFEKITFPRLYKVTLVCLDSLKSFSPGRYAIEWPSLEILTIVSCREMGTFGHGDQVTPKLKKVLVGNNEEIWMGDLNATVERIFNEEAWPLVQAEVHETRSFHNISTSE